MAVGPPISLMEVAVVGTIPLRRPAFLRGGDNVIVAPMSGPADLAG